MANPLIECVPNFSEGRRPEVIQAIVEAITNTGGVRLLDTSSDKDHNRTVVTFVGNPAAVEEAAYAGIRTAAQHIDLDVHRGEHPRIGATDVVPFIPIQDATLEDCVAIANRLGRRVGQLGIPVYLYEAAATRPERENLENVRRGEYEGLKDAIKTDPARLPDYGPSQLGKAGATVIGARPPLVAFNVYLTTDNVEIAKKIAKAIRHSSGGLRYVKALGLLVEGKAQVSMNLTNFEKTPIYRVVEMVRREAQRYGVNIAFSELIGLAPTEALVDSARWYLQLDLFQPDQLLERRLQMVPESQREQATRIIEPPVPPDATIVSGSLARPATQRERSLSGFMGEVAQGTATPGGGAVAALAGALGASLAEMVGRLTTGKKKYAAVEPEISSAITTAEGLRAKLIDAIDRDIAAYSAVMDAYRRNKEGAPDGAQQIQVAMREAAEVPLRVMQLALEVMWVTRTVADKGNINAATDAAVASQMALAALEGAALNVRVNVKDLTDADVASHLRETVTRLINEARSLSAEVLSIAETRAGLK